MSSSADPIREIRISKVSFIEIQSVFAMKVQSGIISRAEGLPLMQSGTLREALRLFRQPPPAQQQKVKERTESRKRTVAQSRRSPKDSTLYTRVAQRLISF